jgi:hypothetical protein
MITDKYTKYTATWDGSFSDMPEPLTIEEFKDIKAQLIDLNQLDINYPDHKISTTDFQWAFTRTESRYEIEYVPFKCERCPRVKIFPMQKQCMVVAGIWTCECGFSNWYDSKSIQYRRSNANKD